MKNKNYTLLLIICNAVVLFWATVLHAETDLVDSLKKRLTVEKDPIVRCELLSALSDNASDGEWQIYNSELGELSGGLIGNADSVVVRSAMKHRANYFNNRAVEFVSKAQYAEAVQNFDSAYNIYYPLNDARELALNRNNVGALYDRIDQTKDALDYYRTALKFLRGKPMELYLPSILNNLGVVELKLRDTLSGLSHIKEAVAILRDLEIKPNTGARIFWRMGKELVNMSDLIGANASFKEGFLLASEMGDMSGWASNMSGIGLVFLKRNEVDSALFYSKKSLIIADSLELLNEIVDAASVCGAAYEAKGDFRKALEMYRTAQTARDSINKRDNIKSILGYQVKTELEERQRLKEEKSKREMEEAEMLKRIQYLGIFIAILFLITAFMVMRKMNISVKLIDNIGFISVLLLFQFIEVVLNPYIDKYSFGNPVVFMGINFGIASMVKPLHDFIERKVFNGGRRG